MASPHLGPEAAPEPPELSLDPIAYYPRIEERRQYVPQVFQSHHDPHYDPPPYTLPLSEQLKRTQNFEVDRTRARAVVLRILGKKRNVLGGEPEDADRDAILAALRLWVASLSFFTLLLFIIIGTTLPNLEEIPTSNSLWLFTLILQCCVPALTLVNIIALLWELRTTVRFRKAESGEMNTFFRTRRSSLLWKTVAEIIIHIPQPCPYYYQRYYILSFMMFLRLYLLVSLIKPLSYVFLTRFSIFPQSVGKSNKYDIKVGARMIVRIELFRKTTQFFCLMVILGAVMGTFLLYIVEIRPFYENNPSNIVSVVDWVRSLWFSLYWLYQVGETPEFPTTDTGKLSLFVVALFGWMLLVFLGSVMTNLLRPSPVMLEVVEYHEQLRKEEAYKEACSKVMQNMWRSAAAGDPNAKAKLRANLFRALREMRQAKDRRNEASDNVKYAVQLDELMEEEEKVLRVVKILREHASGVMEDRNDVAQRGQKYHTRDTFSFGRLRTLLEEENEALQPFARKDNPELQMEHNYAAIASVQARLNQIVAAVEGMAARYDQLAARFAKYDAEFEEVGDNREDMRATRLLAQQLDKSVHALIDRTESVLLPKIRETEEAIGFSVARAAKAREQDQQRYVEALRRFDALDRRLMDLYSRAVQKCNKEIDSEHKPKAKPKAKKARRR